MCVAAADEGASAACLQRMNTSASDEAPQDSRRRGIGSLRTCIMGSGSSPSDSEAPEACAVRQLPSSTWCVDANSLQLRVIALDQPPHRHLLEVHVSARLESVDSNV